MNPICVKGEPATVEWEDAATHYAEVNSEKYVRDFKPLFRKSNGAVVGFTSDRIFLASEYDGERDDTDNDCQNVTTIPLVLVKRIRFHDSGTQWPPKKPRKKRGTK